MNRDTFKQAFSALHASDEIKLENDMEERKTNRKLHIRPAIAVCFCVAAALGCFSTAFALDAGGMKTAIEDGVKTIQLKAGETYKNTTENGSEQYIEVAEDAEFDINVVKDNSNEYVEIEIRDKADNDKNSESNKSEKSKKDSNSSKKSNGEKTVKSKSESSDSANSSSSETAENSSTSKKA